MEGAKFKKGDFIYYKGIGGNKVYSVIRKITQKYNEIRYWGHWCNDLGDAIKMGVEGETDMIRFSYMNESEVCSNEINWKERIQK